MEKAGLGFLSVSFMYSGAIMGAGFASGREVWQFFGVFGNFGFVGVVLAAVLFMLMGFMASRIARTLNISDTGKVVVPGENRFLNRFVADFMAANLFVAFVTLTAAGGAIFSQQFGLSRILGGAIVVTLVIVTVLGGFDRVSRVSRFFVPVLMLMIVFVSTALIMQSGGIPRAESTFPASPFAGTWYLGSLLYLSYNLLVIIPIVSTASIRAKSKKHAYAGSLLGGAFLGLLSFLLLSAMITDMDFSNAMDMPMLALSESLSPLANIVYLCALAFAVYISATINYYGVTVKFIKGGCRKTKIVAVALVGFALSLVGFSYIIAYVFPIIGYLGISILVMLAVNYVKITRREAKAQAHCTMEKYR